MKQIHFYKDLLELMWIEEVYFAHNETINQLPDKCVKALDAWVDSLTENESKNEN